jgi:hypothetical protein
MPARIISASRRTDIPAFYSRWLLSRLRAGFCHWLNPFSGQVSRVSLRPEDVLAIVFWTRNPRPLLPHLRRLREEGYFYYFHFTINGYPREIETHNPPVAAAIDTLRRVAEVVSPEFVHWRYDPIVLSDRTPPAYHLERFEELSRELEGCTRRCYFSFVDTYGKTKRNLARVTRVHGIRFREPDVAEQRELVRGLRDIARGRGITLYACCEEHLVGEGVEASHCVDLDTVRALRGDADLYLRHAPTRAECGCVESVDIGAYDTCAFGCAYCYATDTREAALRRLREHDPEDTVLWRPPALRGVDLTQREIRPRERPLQHGRTPPIEQIPLLPVDKPP